MLSWQDQKSLSCSLVWRRESWLSDSLYNKHKIQKMLLKIIKMTWNIRGVEWTMVNDNLILIVLIYHTLTQKVAPKPKSRRKGDTIIFYRLMIGVPPWTLLHPTHDTISAFNDISKEMDSPTQTCGRPNNLSHIYQHGG